nr:MAG TPA: hypothetical protein [Bacteriophage sp.]
MENTRFELVTSCMPCIFYWLSWLFIAFHIVYNNTCRAILFFISLHIFARNK